ARRPAPPQPAAVQRAVSPGSQPRPPRFALPVQGFREDDGGVERVKRIISVAATLTIFICWASAQTTDSRFRWSSDKFASQCGVDWNSYLSADRIWFTDRNYYKHWQRVQPEDLKKCNDCYRVGDDAVLAMGTQVARLSLSDESGDWFHEI